MKTCGKRPGAAELEEPTLVSSTYVGRKEQPKRYKPRCAVQPIVIRTFWRTS